MRIEQFYYNDLRGETTFYVMTEHCAKILAHLKTEGLRAGSLSSRNGVSEVIAMGKPDKVSAVLTNLCVS